MKTYQHIIFWILVYGSLTIIFANWFDGHAEAFYYVSLLMPVVMGTSYFFNYFLVPRFLFRQKFLLFGLYTFYLLIISLCLELIASIAAMLLIIYYGINPTGALVTDVFTLAIILYFIVLVKSFILLMKHYFVDQRVITDLEKKQSLLDQGFFTVRSNRQTSTVRFEELLYIESLADYIKIHQSTGTPITSREKISHIQKELPDTFIRIHRSFIVNTTKISAFSMEYVVIDEQELPISRTYKKEVGAKLQKE